MWTCPNCKKECKDIFVRCWSCNTPRDEPTPSAQPFKNTVQHLPPSSGASFKLNDEQNAVIKSLSGYMRLVGIVGVVCCVPTIALGMLTARGTYLLQGILLLVMSIYNFHAGMSFGRVGAASDYRGEDIDHLMDALNSLQRLYRLQFAFIIIGIIAAIFLVIAIVSGR